MMQTERNFSLIGPRKPAAAAAAVPDRVAQLFKQPAVLIDLLSGRHPAIRAVTDLQAVAIKVHVLAHFEGAGLPRKALPLVLDLLQSSSNPGLLAASAKALRGRPPCATHTGSLLKALQQAALAASGLDADGSIGPATGALDEVLATLQRIGTYPPGSTALLKQFFVAHPQLHPQVKHRIKQAIFFIEDARSKPVPDCRCALPVHMPTIDRMLQATRVRQVLGGGVYRNNIIRSGGTALLSLAVAFFPKCPVCWAAYMNLLGVAGLQVVPYSPWLLPVFITVLVGNAVYLLYSARKRRRYRPFLCHLAGLLLVLVLYNGLQVQAALYPGIGLIVVGSLMNRWPADGPARGLHARRTGLPANARQE